MLAEGRRDHIVGISVIMRARIHVKRQCTTEAEHHMGAEERKSFWITQYILQRIVCFAPSAGNNVRRHISEYLSLRRCVKFVPPSWTLQKKIVLDPHFLQRCP